MSATVELRGRTQTYRVSFGVNAMADLEDAVGLPIRDVLKRFRAKRPDPVLVRRFLRAVLVGGDQMDDRSISRALRDIGGVSAIRAAVKGLV